ncbi:MAG: nodulation protein NfeD [Clostridiales bacterium]|nr:nodulation protein NfeD [Clostridiales bacterium]
MSKCRSATTFFLFVVFLLMAILPGLSSAAVEESYPSVYVISIENAVERGLSSYMERAFSIIAQDPSAELVILEIDTPGGYVTAAQSIRKTIESCPLETVAFVRGGAISAGTYIAMSCDRIAMLPGTTIGDVEPRAGDEVADEKFLSYWRAEMSSLAEAHGRDKEIAKAMVDRSLEIEGVKAEGQLLTLTAYEALEVGYADFIVAGRWELKSIYGLENATEMGVDTSFTEEIARFITNPAVAPFILMIGIAGVVIEVFTAGFGVAGIVGGGCLILYFAGHYISGFTGWEAFFLFLAGLILMFMEGVMPGFGVPGVCGILCFTASIILMSPDIQTGLQSFAIALVGAIILIWLAVKFLGRSKWWDRFSLQQSLGAEEGYVSQNEDFSQYIGRKGKVETTLRPAGIVVLDDGKRLDVVSDGVFIQKGQEVFVVMTDGPRILVSVDAPHPAGEKGEPGALGEADTSVSM